MDGAETSNQRENLRGRHFVAGPIMEISSTKNMKEEFLLGSSIFIHDDHNAEIHI